MVAIRRTASFFVPGGATAAGWTLYAPLSAQMGPGMDLAIFAVHIMGASSIMGAINVIVTILNMRAPGMTLMKMPMFCWTWRSDERRVGKECVSPGSYRWSPYN